MTTVSDPLFAATQRALAGQYSLERELGRGGMGVVYLAREVELDRDVALKVLPTAIAREPGVREQFLREARMAASLSHPNVVPIYRVGESGDVVYFSMAFVDGETLGERLRSRGPLSPSAATRVLREVAHALAYAHGRGIVHRDIKPDNILLERESGRALVTDFGIAAAPLNSASTHHVIGTAHFMSPEQAAGAAFDARSDLYSLGVVGFLCLSGKLPKHGQSLADASPSTPRHLVSAIDRARSVDPAERHATAEAFANAVEARGLERMALPAPLREWVSTRDPWTIPYVAWSASMLATGVVLYVHAATNGRASHITEWALPFALAAQSIAPASLFRLRKARKLFDGGYTVADMRVALDVWDAERDAARAEEPEKPASWRHGIARAIAWLPIGLTTWGYFHGWTNKGWSLPVPLISSAFSLAILAALGVPIFPKTLHTPENEFSRLFWGSRFGEWMERALMYRRRRGATANAFRPTERVLASAVSDLFAALPAAYQEQLRELPGVIDRLQSHAQGARESLSRFEGVTAVPRHAELAAAQDGARRELTESVSALESIRLDLLRLMGGDADLSPTTTVISAARRIDQDLNRLREASREVDRTVHPLGLDLRPHSPA